MRIAVVPLRWGAGVKGKVNSAMSHGVPVVCTKIAQEGMFLIHGEDALIKDDPIEFANEIINLYNNEHLWNKLRSGGFENIKKHFSISNAVEGMLSTFQVILEPNQKKGENENNLHLSNHDKSEKVIQDKTHIDLSGFDSLLKMTKSSSSSLLLNNEIVAHQHLLKKKIEYGACVLNSKYSCSSEIIEGRAPLI